MRKLLLAVLAASTVLASGNSASAQSDFLKRSSEMLRRLPGGGSSSPTRSPANLTEGEIGAGLREALKLGADRVVKQVGVLDGFNADPKIHIPLPQSLSTVQGTLSRIGMSGMMDDLETRLNRAAEAAAPEAREIFWTAIDDMTWEDVRGIYEGPPDSATRYLEKKMSLPLTRRMKPVVDASLADVGAVRAYDSAMSRYKSVPFVPDAKADLTDYVLERTLRGVFHYLGQEEAAIRQNPAKRTTELLQKVFGR